MRVKVLTTGLWKKFDVAIASSNPARLILGNIFHEERFPSGEYRPHASFYAKDALSDSLMFLQSVIQFLEQCREICELYDGAMRVSGRERKASQPSDPMLVFVAL